VESLADARSRIELTNVRQSDDRVFATVFVPEGKLTAIETKLTDYLERKKDKNGNARDHQKLIDAIASFRAAALEALWTDSADQFPSDEQEDFWWEVWLPVRDDRQAVIHDFKQLAETLQIQVSGQVLEFPERSIVLAKGMRRQFAQSGLLLNCISEVRRAKETAAFFDELPPAEHPEWADDLLKRLDGPSADGPFVCVLDSGTNSGHPLIRTFLADSDQFSVDADWTGTDDHGHGTGMAGLAIWGDLTDALESDSAVRVTHRLESVKVLREPGDNEGRHHGILTADAVSLAEIDNPFRRRIFSMALSTTDSRDRGRPSAWSGALDSLAADALGQNASPRLFTIAAGNTGNDLTALTGYPDYNVVQDIHDPGQAWNALTVGAYTAKTTITEPECSDYQPLAPEGGLSPYSTTSVTWEKAMPLKPDVVFEGGNVGVDSAGCVGIPSLKLLTAFHRPLDPSIARALWSASNSLALIVEDRLQPFEKTKKGVGTRNMHLHDLPWPKAALQDIGNTDVEMVVTLSYFVEPNPSSRNVAGKYSYASHQLRFDVKRPLESLDDFRRRINREARDVEEGTTTGGGDPGWLLGTQFRHKGSIHKDIWRGKAINLAERGQIAVYPAMGWWRTRTKLERYDKEARYALVVSIRAPEVNVDIYDEIVTQIQVAQQV
jgi:hypothetical protein